MKLRLQSLNDHKNSLELIDRRKFIWINYKSYTYLYFFLSGIFNSEYSSFIAKKLYKIFANIFPNMFAVWNYLRGGGGMTLSLKG